MSENNYCNREASSIVGNMVADYPDDLYAVINSLLEDAKDRETAFRWGSAYALPRFIISARFSKEELVHKVQTIYESEKKNSMKNQYSKTLKRLKIK